jgi:hypothetical protein
MSWPLPSELFSTGRFVLTAKQFGSSGNTVTSIREEPVLGLGRTPTIQAGAVEVYFVLSTQVPG